MNVVCGADNAEPVFTFKTVQDGVDLEFDGTSELFISIRYSRYAYTTNDLAGCDPLLSALIRRRDPYASSDCIVVEDDNSTVTFGSEFEDEHGRVYRVTRMDATHVFAMCFYPRRCDNESLGSEKSFDIALAKILIQQRLNG